MTTFFFFFEPRSPALGPLASSKEVAQFWQAKTMFQRHAWIPHTMGVISPDSKIPCLVMRYSWPILSHSNSVASFASGYNGERFVFEIPTLCICIYKYTVDLLGCQTCPKILMTHKRSANNVRQWRQVSITIFFHQNQKDQQILPEASIPERLSK